MPAEHISSPGKEDRFQLLMDSIEDCAIYLLDCAGHITSWNRGSNLKNGYTREEVLGNSFTMFFVPEDVASDVPSQELKFASIFGHCAGEGWRQHKNGERFWASFVLTAMRDTGGNLIGFANVTRDITERKRNNDALLAMEATVREERDRLRGAAENSMDALYICDTVRGATGEIEDFVFTYLNSNVEKMASLSRSAMLGRKMCEVLSVNRTSCLFDLYKQVVLTGKPLVEEFPIDESATSAWIRIQAVKLRDGIAITASDITQRKLDEQRMLHLAQHDPLTGLPNRVLMVDRIGQAMERARCYGTILGIFLIDLDCFKHINDTLGHIAGDTVLLTVGSRLQTAVRVTDTVLRIGGDEFVVVMPDLRDVEDAHLFADKILESFRLQMLIAGHCVQATCSVGVTFYQEGADSIEDLVSRADAAMYRAKRCGGNQFEICHP